MSERVAPPALRAVAFDFDGVILESGSIKQQAFLDMFAHRPELAPAVLDHHRQNLGVSRYDKLAWMHRELLGRPLDAEELAEEGRRYSRLVLEKVLACPLVAGAEALLRGLRGRALSFVVSATPQAELELIVERRGLREYFDELHGAPQLKPEILRDLMRRHDLATDELLMVGDGLSDYKAARRVGVEFVLRETAEQERLFRGIDVGRVADLVELAPRLEERLAVGPAPPASAGGGAVTAYRPEEPES